MRRTYRVLMSVATVALAAAGVVLVTATPAQAKPPVFTVWDGGEFEYVKTCSNVAPFTCSTTALTMYVQITGPYPPKSYAINLGYRIDDITTTAGVDYTGPATGTATIAAGQYVTYVPIPLVADGAAESDETLRVSLTSSSIGGNISDTGIGTIFNDGQIPGDCSLFKPDLATTDMTCTGRPPSQQWQHVVTCKDLGAWGEWHEYGPVITGNGTSTVICDDYVGYLESAFVAL